MSKTTQWIVLVTLNLGLYIPLPAVMIWGWVRWAKRTQPRTLPLVLSLIGFTFATASALVEISSELYSLAIGDPIHYDPVQLDLYLSGRALSIAGIGFAISGAWRPSPLRWHALVCAAGMLIFWFEFAVL